MDAQNEAVFLRRCIRDVVAMTALPSMWMGGDSAQVVDTLADVLVGLLQLDFVYIRVMDGPRMSEAGRVSDSPRTPGLSRLIGSSLEPWLDGRAFADGKASASVPHPVDGTPTRATALALGRPGQGGLIVAGKRRPDFPTEIDRLLLRIGANQTAVLLDRVSADEQLRTSHERFSILARATNDAIRDWDLEADALWWNDCVTLLFGYAADEIGTDVSWWVERIHPDDRARVLLGTESVVNGGTTHWRDEYRFMRADGVYAHVLDRGYAMRDPTGRPIRLVGSMTEISAQKRAEAEREDHLRRERQRSSQLKGLAAIGTRFGAASDMDTMIQVITDQARTLIGAHLAITSMTTGPSWAQASHCSSQSDTCHPWLVSESQPDRAAIYALVSNQNQPMRMTKSEMEAHPRWSAFVTGGHNGLPPPGGGLPPPGGGLTPPWGETEEPELRAPVRGWLAAPLIGRDGGNIGLIQLSDKIDGGDFTDEDEAILLQLTQMAAVAIENARLYQRLKDDDRRKDEFLTTIAHELRNPLAPIRHALEVIRLAGDSSPRIEGVRKLMERQVRQIVRLVDDLLDVSRITRGKVELRRERMDLALAVQSAMEASDPLIRAAGHTLTVVFPPERVYVYADLNRMAQVFSNLLNNAAKYTERGGQITLAVEVDPGWAVVRVKDSGVGIPAEMLGRVFDMFIQVDGVRERAQGGLGIGLTLVRSLVGMHGGTVEAHSQGVGRGCEFVVRVPRAEDPNTGT